MLGAIIGDIVGSRFEFNPTNDYNFELFSPQCSFTDDTICTIAIADALLKDRDFGASLHDWCNRYSHPMGGYGCSFAKWVHSPNPQPYNSFGNGAAMRVSPIGMWFDNWQDIYPQAEKCAACTHNHPEGIKGAQIIAYAVFCAVTSFDCPLPPDEFEFELSDLVASALSDGDYDMDTDYEDFRNKFDETCQGTVPVAIDIIGKSNSFEDAVRRAVSLGADADTLGAIVGSIAEHIWGIPDEIKEKALQYLPNEMKQVLHDFYCACESRETYKPRSKGKPKNDIDIADAITIMRWKLGWGNMNDALRESPVLNNNKIACANDWQIEPMPEDEEKVSDIAFAYGISEEQMAILIKGHIPAAQEDHWFMYCDEEYIRIYRSWTGICAFEAHYKSTERGYLVDRLRINHALAEFGVNGNDAGLSLFKYLIIAAIGGDAESAWMDYVISWTGTHLKQK